MSAPGGPAAGHPPTQASAFNSPVAHASIGGGAGAALAVVAQTMPPEAILSQMLIVLAPVVAVSIDRLSARIGAGMARRRTSKRQTEAEGKIDKAVKTLKELLEGTEDPARKAELTNTIVELTQAQIQPHLKVLTVSAEAPANVAAKASLTARRTSSASLTST